MAKEEKNAVGKFFGRFLNARKRKYRSGSAAAKSGYDPSGARKPVKGKPGQNPRTPKPPQKKKGK